MKTLIITLALLSSLAFGQTEGFHSHTNSGMWIMGLLDYAVVNVIDCQISEDQRNNLNSEDYLCVRDVDYVSFEEDFNVWLSINTREVSRTTGWHQTDGVNHNTVTFKDGYVLILTVMGDYVALFGGR